MNMSSRVKIKPLVVNLWKQGTCFVCGNPCEPEAYAHYECCLAYDDLKTKRTREYELSTKNS